MDDAVDRTDVETIGVETICNGGTAMIPGGETVEPADCSDVDILVGAMAIDWSKDGVMHETVGGTAA